MDEAGIPLSEPSSCKDSLKISNSRVISWSKHRTYKNLICISSSVFLLYIGFSGSTMLQSTMNNLGGLGVASVAVSYASFGISSLLLPEITIRKLGCKLTLVVSIFAYFPYIASNFYPRWGTLLPSAALAGLFASLFLPSSCKYLNNLPVLYKGNTDREDLAATGALFLGIWDMFYMFASTTGNLMSHFILDDSSKTNSSNGTYIRCGTTFVDDDIFTGNNTNLAEPNKDLRNILIGVYSCCALLAVVPILLILDPLPKNHDEVKKPSLFKKLSATLRVMKRKRQLLLMSFALYFGMQDGFYVGDFTRAYVACALGIHYVGLVTMCLDFSAGVCSILSGRLRKYTGRIPIYAAAALANSFVFVELFLWVPHPENPFEFFMIVIIWGSLHGIYFTQIRAFYGTLFRGENEESAFANFYVWSSVGRVLSLSYSKYLSITTKLYLLILVFCIAHVGYLILEYDVRSCKGKGGIQVSQNEITVSKADEEN